MLQKAVELLRAEQLADAYADAWDSWSSCGESEVWDSASVNAGLSLDAL